MFTSKKFEPSDFEVGSLSEEEFQAYHAHLSAQYVDDYTALIGSKQKGKPPYEVTHDLVLPLTCECHYYSFHEDCKSHFSRMQLVLDRRTARLEREKQALAETPLQHQKGFNLFR